MKAPPRNVAASVRQRLLNISKERNESFQYVLSLYARERFLARLGRSPHRGRLILKGATVFALWLPSGHRPTRDLDFLGIGDFTPPRAEELIREICRVQVEDDGITFIAESVAAEEIRVADEYRGVRVCFSANLAGARIPMQIDIGLGDIVTPAATMQTLPTIFTDPSRPSLKVYPPETIVAEKLHAIVKLGIANSRMKDFYDLSVLAKHRTFDPALLARAVTRTFRRRKTAIPLNPVGLSRAFFEDSAKQRQWRAFLRKTGLEANPNFVRVGATLRRFLVPVLKASHTGG